MTPYGGMFGRIFLFGFKWISLVCSFYWVGRSGVGPGFVFWGFFRVLFSIFGVRNWYFSWFRRLWLVVLGGCLWGNGIGSGTSFMGDIDLKVRA